MDFYLPETFMNSHCGALLETYREEETGEFCRDSRQQIKILFACINTGSDKHHQFQFLNLHVAISIRIGL